MGNTEVRAHKVSIVYPHNRQKLFFYGAKPSLPVKGVFSCDIKIDLSRKNSLWSRAMKRHY